MHVNTSRWSSDFGLYKYNDLKKESTLTKFVVIVTIVGIILFTVFYLCIFLLKNSPSDAIVEYEEEEQECANVSTAVVAEKLVLPGLGSGVPVKQPPSPFVNHIRGPTPVSFVPLPTEKASTVMLPQLQNYARPGLPRNIQDIISYLSPKYEPAPRKPLVFPLHHDPFFPYKPKDPSDINLMATANLRFAPPSWKEIKTNLIPSQSVQKVEEVAKPAGRSPKALTLSLNIFPMANDAKRQNFYGFTSNANPRFVGNGRRRPRKMIIHLNVYGNDEMFEREDEEELVRNVQDMDLLALREMASAEDGSRS